MAVVEKMISLRLHLLWVAKAVEKTPSLKIYNFYYALVVFYWKLPWIITNVHWLYEIQIQSKLKISALGCQNMDWTKRLKIFCFHQELPFSYNILNFLSPTMLKNVN